MEISAGLVKELREKTGAGMMDCKKALSETGGDFEKAIEFLRKKGMASAAKKAGRATKEGAVAAFISNNGAVGALIELNCETDFVARNENYKVLLNGLGAHAVLSKATNLEGLLNETVAASGKTVATVVQEGIASLGENMSLSRFERFEAEAGGKGQVVSYIHGEGKVGVLIDIAVGNASAIQNDAFKAFAKDLTMHVAAAGPQWLTSDNVPAEIIAKEKEIALAQIQNSGKAMKPEFMEKAVDGRVRKLLEEVCLMTQPFVKDPGKTISQLVQETDKAVGGGLVIRRFARFVLGEGQKETAEAVH